MNIPRHLSTRLLLVGPGGPQKAVPPSPMPRDQQGWRVAPAPDGRGMPEEHKPKPPHRLRGFWLFVLVLLALNWASVLFVQPAAQPRVKVPFSPYFLNELRAGQVKSVTSKGDAVQGTLASEGSLSVGRHEGCPPRSFSRLRYLAFGTRTS